MGRLLCTMVSGQVAVGTGMVVVEIGIGPLAVIVDLLSEAAVAASGAFQSACC